MPLPQSHLKSLQRQLEIHEERLTALRVHQKTLEQAAAEGPSDPNPKVQSLEWIKGQRELLQREIRIHEQLIKLGRDPRILEALGDLAQNQEYAREAARDPMNAARKRGIDLPPKMRLRLDLEQDRVQLHITHYEDLYPFVVTWSSDSGFSPPRAASSLRAKA